MANPEPIFASDDFIVVSSRNVGVNHLKLKLATASSKQSFDGIGFGMGKMMVNAGQRVTMAFTPQVNEWQGLQTLQLKIKDICLK
ncbi:MAG: hypothetical protein ABH859_03170 [Pseudomonadota bacterium]